MEDKIPLRSSKMTVKHRRRCPNDDTGTLKHYKTAKEPH